MLVFDDGFLTKEFLRMKVRKDKEKLIGIAMGFEYILQGFTGVFALSSREFNASRGKREVEAEKTLIKPCTALQEKPFNKLFIQCMSCVLQKYFKCDTTVMLSGYSCVMVSKTLEVSCVYVYRKQCACRW